MIQRTRIKQFGYLVIGISALSLIVHLLLANNSTGIGYTRSNVLVDDLYPSQGPRHRKLWGPVSSLETLQPYANLRDKTSSVPRGNNGFIYAKIYGGFDKIQSSVCDLVAVSRLLNATLVIPEIQLSLRSKGISTKFKSFSYIYDEELFISALSNDIIIVKTLPTHLKEARKKTKFPTFSTKGSETLDFYLQNVLPKLKQSKAIGLIVSTGGCLESILPASMSEYQKLRCRVAFHALQFRSEIRALGNKIVQRLRVSNRPYLAYHPGLVRDSLAYHGCAELFQDVHTELIQYTRKQMIAKGAVKDQLSVDSFARKKNGSCPLMPEEVGLILRALGYPSDTRIYITGSETFGGQRILIPLRSLYPNLFDLSSLSSPTDLQTLTGPEPPLPSTNLHPPPVKPPEKLLEEWKNAGPRPRPLPPPPARPFYAHEKEGWYGWVAEMDSDPGLGLEGFRSEAHRILWDAVDFYVAVQADVFFPGFNYEGSQRVDFSGLVMGQRVYRAASSVTYRPDRKELVDMFANITENLYHPPRNWSRSLRSHLNKTLGAEGLIAEAQLSKPKSFLSHPLPECLCTTLKPNKAQPISYYKGLEECPAWMVKTKLVNTQSETEDLDLPDDDVDVDHEPDKDSNNGSSEQDQEMDPDD
ncbi:hypothetical protein LUZ60_007676 [Juncus effusus]|nr:hypothetical protein LUZ60_007676 [Juncus effusus]